MKVDNEELNKQLKLQKETAHNELNSIINDFTSPLKSLPDDGMLILSHKWRGRPSVLPKRSELRIKKSDLLLGEEPLLMIVRQN